MGRGRPRSISDDRLLIELLLYPDRAVFTSELAEEVDVTAQTIRERMEELVEQGHVEKNELDGGNLYRLTEEGMDRLRDRLRADYQ